MNETNNGFLQCARALHQRAIVIDTHCDTTQRLVRPDWDISRRHDDGHVDLPRMREGGVDALFLAIWAPAPCAPGEARDIAMTQFECIKNTIATNQTALAHARTAGDIRTAVAQKRISVLIGVEGGYLIDDSLELLREYQRCGALYLTLTHATHTNWADSSGVHESLQPQHGGLTPFGRDVVRELNRLGMMVDVSHASDDTVRDVLETSVAPVVATHSSCRAVSPHRRNLSDELMRDIAASGGLIQINFAAAFIDRDHPPFDPEAIRRLYETGGCVETAIGYATPLSVLVDHFDHALATVGPDHVGIGSDFDGVPALPKGMEDCSKLPFLTAELLRRGYAEDDLEKVLGGNVLRVMECCCRRGDSNLVDASPPGQTEDARS